MFKHIKILILPFLVLTLAMLSCNLLPGFGAEDDLSFAQTAAAETVAALALVDPTLSASLDETEEPTPTETTETMPTDTPEPEPTITPTTKPCNRASFVSDVTIPDGTQMMVGQAFTKTWRLRNDGSCTWSSGYQLVFNSGDQMGGPVSQQLTPSTVAPGGTLDISVDLVAPASAGTYKGFWELRSPQGEAFALASGPFWVEIVAVAPTDTPVVVLPPPIVQMSASLVVEESGSVRSNGQVLTPRNVGDTSANVGSQAFISFDISEIPAGSTITHVEFDFTNYDTLGNPFSLGCLRMYKQDYGTLDSSDWFAGLALGALMRWCNTGELDTATEGGEALVEAVQSYAGGPRAKFRLQFNEQVTNNNGVSDMVRFGQDIILIITYTAP